MCSFIALIAQLFYTFISRPANILAWPDSSTLYRGSQREGGLRFLAELEELEASKVIYFEATSNHNPQYIHVLINGVGKYEIFHFLPTYLWPRDAHCTRCFTVRKDSMH